MKLKGGLFARVLIAQKSTLCPSHLLLYSSPSSIPHTQTLEPQPKSTGVSEGDTATVAAAFSSN